MIETIAGKLKTAYRILDDLEPFEEPPEREAELFFLAQDLINEAAAALEGNDAFEFAALFSEMDANGKLIVYSALNKCATVK